MLPPASRNYNYPLRWNESNAIKLVDIKVDFPKRVFYENVYLKYETTPDNSEDVFSQLHHIGTPVIPVHSYYTLAIKPTNLPNHLKDKAVIAFCKGDEMISQGGRWKDGWLTAKVRSLGDFCITIDDKPPTIEPGSFKKNMTGAYSMSFKIKDSMPIGGKAKAIKYKGYIDNKWVLMTLDEKNNKLIHSFDSRTGKGEHVVKIVVTDDRGNEAIFQETFVRN